MAKVSLSEAARLAGIARSTLYEKYVNTGKITVETEERDGREHRVIDQAELYRVFGDNLNVSGADNSENVRSLRPRTLEDGQANSYLQTTVEVLQEQLRTAQERERAHQERERWYQGQLESMAGALKLLEHRTAAPAHDPAAESRAKEQAAALEAERTRATVLEAELTAERSRGFFSRMFGRRA
jgi:hypothetical protein